MIVGDPYIQGVTVFPFETYSPLIVDSNAVLALAVPRKLFEPIPGRHSEITQRVGSVEQKEFLQGNPVNRLRELLRAFAIEKPFRLRVFKTPNHKTIITPCGNNVKRY